MDFIQMIGWMISLVALFYLFMKHNQAPQQVEHSEELKNKESRTADLLYGARESREKKGARKEENLRSPVALPSVRKRSISPFEENDFSNETEKKPLKKTHAPHLLKSTITQHYEKTPSRVVLKPFIPLIDYEKSSEPSRAHKALQRLNQRSDLIIYQEIIDKPKSLRPL